MRGQTSLPVLGVALLLLTLTTTLGVTVADGALADADRAALDRQAAIALSDRLVSARAPLTDRSNIVNGSRAGALTEERVRRRYGIPDGTAVSVRLGNTTLVDGDLSGEGAEFERIVLVRTTQTRTLSPDLPRGRSLTLPRRAGTALLQLTPPATTNLTAVRANERIVLRNESGLRGTFTLALSRLETTRLAFRADGPLRADSVRVRYTPAATHKAVLEVRVDG